MQPGGTTSHAVYPTLTADAQFLFDESYCCIGDPQGCSWLCFSPRIPAPYGDPFAVDDFPRSILLVARTQAHSASATRSTLGTDLSRATRVRTHFMRLSGADGGPVAADASTGDDVWFSRAAVSIDAAVSNPYPEFFRAQSELSIPHDSVRLSRRRRSRERRAHAPREHPLIARRPSPARRIHHASLHERSLRPARAAPRARLRRR